MKKTLPVTTALALVLTLSACAVSEDERGACEAQGGSVESEKFPYDGTGFWDANTGPLDYCEVDGRIVEVYSDEVVELKTGFFSSGSSHDNEEVFERCLPIEGRVYETTVAKQGHYYVCVAGGQVKPVLY